MYNASSSVDNPAENDESPYRSMEVHIIMAMLGTFSCIGIVGNAVVIYVYTRSKMDQPQTAGVFIVSLAVGDFVASSLTMPFTMAFEYTKYQFSDSFTCRFYGLLLTSTIPFSSLVMVGIAIDRYLCICHPFRQMMNVRRAVGMVCFFTLIAGTYGTLGAILYNIAPDGDDPNCLPLLANQTQVGPSANDFELQINASAIEYDNPYLPMLDAASVALATQSGVDPTPSAAPAPEDAIENESVNTAACRIVCHEEDAILLKIYRNFNLGLFMLAVLVVFVLYALIYESVSRQRRKKMRMLGRSIRNSESEKRDSKIAKESSAKSAANGNGSKNGSTKTHGRSNASKKLVRDCDNSVNSNADDLQRSRLADERIKNLKTAFMLFIVTIVFVISFMPCIILILMSIADPDMMPPGVLFYMYFLMNAANPVIYCFMNPNFRQSLYQRFRHKR